MSTEGNDPNAGHDGADGAAKLDEKTLNAIHAAVRVQLTKGLEAGFKPLRDENAALKAELAKLAELKGKGAAGQESGGKPAGKTEQELKMESLQREMQELKAENDRTKRDAEAQRVRNTLNEAANGKVRSGMLPSFTELAQRAVKTAADGTLSIEVDGQSYDVKSGVAALLKRGEYEGFNQPVQTPPRPVKSPLDSVNFSGAPIDISKMPPADFEAALFKPKG